jgi:hypothetical protein
MIENFKSEIRQFLPRHCLFPLVSLGDFLRKKAFSRNPEITVTFRIWRIEDHLEFPPEAFWVQSRGMGFRRDGMKELP